MELAVEDLPLRFVAKGIEPSEDASEGVASVLAEQSLDVFKQEERWLLRLNESEEGAEDGTAPCVIESLSASCLAVRLAGEAADKEVEVGEGDKVKSGDVAIVGVQREVLVINLESAPVDLAMADALPGWCRLTDAKLEAADTGERAEIAKWRWLWRSCCSRW